jgi:hypothetical protein
MPLRIAPGWACAAARRTPVGHRLNRFARNNAVCSRKLSGQEAPWGVARSLRLVHRAALSILLDVPAQNRHDAIQLAGLVADAFDPPPLAQRRCVAKRLARYFGAMLDGKYVLDAPRQWVWIVADDSMAPAFPAGSNALYERHKGELVAGRSYIFHTRRSGKPIQLVRRYLHTTPTGRIALEMFKGDWRAAPSLSRTGAVARLLTHRSALVATMWQVSGIDAADLDAPQPGTVVVGRIGADHLGAPLGALLEDVRLGVD